MTPRSPLGKLGIAFVAAVLLSGCATTAQNPKDPYEGFNRAMFSFNEAVDNVAVKPVATVYQNVLPSFVRTGVGNFFGNIGDIWIAVNNLLQGKTEDSMSDVARVIINTTFGVAGIFDVATEAGLPKHDEDFGQTLGKWGCSSGPYVVLPILGSSTVRDTIALPADFFGDPVGYKHPVHVRNQARVLRFVDRRAAALEPVKLIEEAALDKYEFVRDAYLQRRQNQIEDNGAAKPNYDDNAATGKGKARQ